MKKPQCPSRIAIRGAKLRRTRDLLYRYRQFDEIFDFGAISAVHIVAQPVFCHRLLPRFLCRRPGERAPNSRSTLRRWNSEARLAFRPALTILQPAGAGQKAVARRHGALKDALGDADVVIINAGSSAGTEDYTYQAVANLGEVLVHGVSMMPGKPTLLGVVNVHSGTADVGLGIPGGGQGSRLGFHSPDAGAL